MIKLRFWLRVIHGVSEWEGPYVWRDSVLDTSPGLGKYQAVRTADSPGRQHWRPPGLSLVRARLRVLQHLYQLLYVVFAECFSDRSCNCLRVALEFRQSADSGSGT